jgi:hypothetical protein
MGRRDVFPFNYTEAFALQLWKSTENLFMFRRVATGLQGAGICCLLRESRCWAAERQFTSVTWET